MPAVQEFGEVHGAARGPGLGLVQVDEKRGHHMVLAEGPEEPLAGLGVVVGHAEHVAWGAESVGEPQSSPPRSPAPLQRMPGQPGASTSDQAAPLAAKAINQKGRTKRCSLCLGGTPRAAQISQCISGSSEPRGRSARSQALAHRIRQIHQFTPVRAILSAFAGPNQLLPVPEAPRCCPRLGGWYPSGAGLCDIPSQHSGVKKQDSPPQPLHPSGRDDLPSS